MGGREGVYPFFLNFVSVLNKAVLNWRKVLKQKKSLKVKLE